MVFANQLSFNIMSYDSGICPYCNQSTFSLTLHVFVCPAPVPIYQIKTMANTDEAIINTEKDTGALRCRRCLLQFELNQLFENRKSLYCATCIQIMDKLENKEIEPE